MNDSEAIGEVLRQRAAKLASPPQPLADASGAREVLHFSVAGRSCLLELASVREVRRLRGLAAIPLGPPHLCGLAPWRGRMLAVLDLCHLLALPSAAAPRLLLVLGRHQSVAALAIDEVHGLLPLPAGEAELRARPLEGLRPEIVRGVSADGQFLLDGERLLELPRAAAP